MQKYVWVGNGKAERFGGAMNLFLGTQWRQWLPDDLTNIAPEYSRLGQCMLPCLGRSLLRNVQASLCRSVPNSASGPTHALKIDFCRCPSGELRFELSSSFFQDRGKKGKKWADWIVIVCRFLELSFDKVHFRWLITAGSKSSSSFTR